MRPNAQLLARGRWISRPSAPKLMTIESVPKRGCVHGFVEASGSEPLPLAGGSLEAPRPAQFVVCCRFRAFTLVEMLVVIAITALLASLLLPSLAKARALGHRTKCCSNLRQIEVATRLYFDDFSCYPMFEEPETHRYWPDLITSYISQTWTNGISIVARVFLTG